MDKELLINLGTYSEIYECVAGEGRTREELFRYLQEERGKPRTTADGQVKKAFDGQLQMIESYDDTVTLDKYAAYEFLSELCESFGFDIVCSPDVPDPKDEIRVLKKEIDDLKAQLKHMAEKPVANAIVEYMENATLSLESVDLYTPEEKWEPFFISSPSELVKLETVLGVQGGERDSMYRIIEDREKDMSTYNYIIKVAKQIFTGKSIESWVYALTHLEKVEKGKKKRKNMITHDELTEERIKTINYILSLPLTNQANRNLNH